MSRTYKIQTDKVFPLVEMVNKLTELIAYRPLCGRMAHPTYYFYNFSSLRGVDVTQEEGGIEIRVTILSNHHDHKMAGSIINILKKMTGGELVDDDGKTYVEWFYDGNINDRMAEDMNIVEALLKEKEEVTLFGPFGEYPLDPEIVLPIFYKKEPAHTRFWRLEKLLKQPYEQYFEMLR